MGLLKYLGVCEFTKAPRDVWMRSLVMVASGKQLLCEFCYIVSGGWVYAAVETHSDVVIRVLN